jgi:cell division septum initiation protein DivIVA
VEPGLLEESPVSLTETESHRITPVSIATRRFAAARHGYETEEVHAFLEAVSEHVRELETELRRQQARMGLLERRVAAARDAAYARVFRQMMEVVRAAEHVAEDVRAGAEAEARSIVEAARKQAASAPAAEVDLAVPDEVIADETGEAGNGSHSDMSIDIEMLWGPDPAGA